MYVTDQSSKPIIKENISWAIDL